MKWMVLILVLGLAAALAWTYFSAPRAVPPVGGPAPEFALPDQSGALRRLDEFRGQWVVLYFYPKNDTPGCTTEACAFRDDWTAIRARNAQIVGVSVDDPVSHAGFAAKYRLPLTLLADPRGEVVARYGALVNLLGFKFARRHTFVIDPEGRIHRAFLKVDPAKHAREVLEALEKP